MGRTDVHSASLSLSHWLNLQHSSATSHKGTRPTERASEKPEENSVNTGETFNSVEKKRYLREKQQRLLLNRETCYLDFFGSCRSHRLTGKLVPLTFQIFLLLLLLLLLSFPRCPVHSSVRHVAFCLTSS